MSELILASKSPVRAKILENAGLRFLVISAQIDERSVEAPLLKAGSNPADIAQILALAKAEDVSKKNPEAYVIGCDQVLSFEDQLLHKVNDMEAARRRLLDLSGKTHHLETAICLVRNGRTMWSHIERATITMRKYSPEFVGRHLARVGEGVLASVGAYQFEGVGVQLFEQVEGDFFTILGLPLLPLLTQLRFFGAIEG